ncbi:MAG TPA: serine/threonine-protein kinase [Phycisphaerae bacterium]|nr:serine/threonine-protein kinase [Phycisphaerae bacterium]HRW51793.1 serine/threonine-protein kinase [Phycisphaerae bacterium]
MNNLTSKPDIPNYDLTQFIASGGFGEVWLAQERLTGQRRAVKLLDKSHASRSHREIEGVRQYQCCSNAHPHLLQILTVGETDSHYYYVMETADCDYQATNDGYVPRTLRTYIEESNQLDVRGGLTICSKLLSALERLHGQNLAHFDVKPENILFVDGEPKIADLSLFGAKDRETVRAGTVGYRTPTGEADDLYAVGRVLYELVTGLPAAEFPRLPGDRMNHRVKGLAETIRIINKACHTDPGRRFTSATQLMKEIEDAKAPTLPWWQRSRASVVGGAAIIVFVCLIILMSLGLRSPERIQSVEFDAASTRNREIHVIYESFDKWKEIRVEGEYDLSLVRLLSGDDRASDMVLVGLSRHSGIHASSLLSFNSNLDLNWEASDVLSPPPDIANMVWPDCGEYGHWQPMHVIQADLDIDGTPEIVVVAKSAARCYQWSILVLNKNSGEREEGFGRFLHFGNIDGIVAVENFFPDNAGVCGRPALVAWGVNNKLDGFGQGGGLEDIPSEDYPVRYTSYDMVPFVMILDPTEIEGVGPPDAASVLDTAWFKRQSLSQQDSLAAVATRLTPAHIHAYAFLDMPTGPHRYRPCNGDPIRLGSTIDQIDTAHFGKGLECSTTFRRPGLETPLLDLQVRPEEISMFPNRAMQQVNHVTNLIVDRRLNLVDHRPSAKDLEWSKKVAGRYRVLIQEGQIVMSPCDDNERASSVSP